MPTTPRRRLAALAPLPLLALPVAQARAAGSHIGIVVLHGKQGMAGDRPTAPFRQALRNAGYTVQAPTLCWSADRPAIRIQPGFRPPGGQPQATSALPRIAKRAPSGILLPPDARRPSHPVFLPTGRQGKLATMPARPHNRSQGNDDRPPAATDHRPLAAAY